MNKEEVFSALERIVNDALSSRDGYGDTHKDAEVVRTALTCQPEPVNAQLLEALKFYADVNNMDDDNYYISGIDLNGEGEFDMGKIAREAIAAAEKAGV